MFFTNESQDEIERLHKEVHERVGVKHEENLKVKLAYYKINEAHPSRI